MVIVQMMINLLTFGPVGLPALPVHNVTRRRSDGRSVYRIACVSVDWQKGSTRRVHVSRWLNWLNTSPIKLHEPKYQYHCYLHVEINYENVYIPAQSSRQDQSPGRGQWSLPIKLKACLIQIWPSCCFYVPSAAIRCTRNVKAARGSDLIRTRPTSNLHAVLCSEGCKVRDVKCPRRT